MRFASPVSQDQAQTRRHRRPHEGRALKPRGRCERAQDAMTRAFGRRQTSPLCAPKTPWLAVNGREIPSAGYTGDTHDQNRKNRSFKKPFRNMVVAGGIEPPTLGLLTQRKALLGSSWHRPKFAQKANITRGRASSASRDPLAESCRFPPLWYLFGTWTRCQVPKSAGA